MFDSDTTYSRQPASITEQYTAAAGTSNLRVGNDPNVPTPGDLIAAAGMNKHRMGLALKRLVSEWNSGAVPAPAEAPALKELAQCVAADRFKRDIASRPPMPRAQVEALRAAHRVSQADMEIARRDLASLHARSTDWQLEENMLRFQRLKTLAAVRLGLLRHVQAKGWEGGTHLVAAVIQRFLSPVCPACHGRIGAKLPCNACKGRGEAKVPHGGRGRSLLAHMHACMASAAKELREGKRMRRTEAGDADREREGGEQQIDKYRRIADEDRQDAQQDVQAVREHFALGKRRLRT